MRSNPSPAASRRLARWGVIGALSAVLLLLPLFGVGETYAEQRHERGVPGTKRDRSRRRERRAERDGPAPQEQHVVHGARREAAAGSHPRRPVLPQHGSLLRRHRVARRPRPRDHGPSLRDRRPLRGEVRHRWPQRRAASTCSTRSPRTSNPSGKPASGWSS